MNKRCFGILLIGIILCFTACGNTGGISSSQSEIAYTASSPAEPQSSSSVSEETVSSQPEVSYLEFPEDYEAPVLVAANGQILQVVAVDGSEAKKGPSFLTSSVVLYNRLDGPTFPLPTDAPYIPLGGLIQIQFQGEIPGNVELLDDVIDEDGRIKFNGNHVTNTIPLTFENGKASFSLPYHIMASLSEEEQAYQPGGISRGFRLLCEYGSREEFYMFVLRTDLR